MKAYHWYFLAQPSPFPENLIGGDPDFFVHWTLRSWAAEGFRFDPESLEDYLTCFRDPACIRATCADYRAGWTSDREADERDRGARTISAPLLVIWGEQYGLAKLQPVAIWKRWANDVRGHSVPGGHFVCEEAAPLVSAALAEFFEMSR
jgi:haloacetate dehalogenase